MPKRKRGDEKIYRHGKVYKYDNEGNYISEFESYSTCCDLEGISAGHLWDILNDGKTKRVKGFIYTYDYYIKFPIDKKLIDGRKKSPQSEVLYQYDLDGNFIKEWESITQASKELKINRCHIGNASKSDFKRQGRGFLWSRIFIDKAPKFKRTPSHSKIVEQYSLKGKLVNTFKSGAEASRKTGINRFSIYHCVNENQKTAGGFFWKYK